MRLTEEVRRTAQEIAAAAQWVTVDESALDAVQRAAPPQLDPAAHYLEGSRGGRRDVPRLPGHDQLRVRLVARRSASGRACPATSRWPRGWPSGSGPTGRGAPPSCARCAPRRSPTRWGRPATTSSWRCTRRRCASSAAWLGGRGTLEAVARGRTGRPSASPRTSPTGMAMFDDRGFYKRAQIVAVRPRARRRRATSATSTASRSSPTTSSRTSCAATASSSTTRGSRSTSTPSARCGRARRSARSAPARSTRASSSPRGSASAPTRSTTGCGSAGRRRSTRRGPRHRCRTVFY